MRLTMRDLGRFLPPGAAAIVFVAFAHPVAPQQATLVGVVRDTAGGPIEGGEILGLTSRRLTAVSTRGRFVLSALPDGPDVFLIRAIGFRPERLAVTLAPGDTIEIEVVLQRIAQTLPEVTVEVRGKVFAGRLAEVAKRVLASGASASSFIDRAQLERWARFDLADVLRRAGLVVQGNQVSCPRIASQLSPGQGAPNVAVYLDGGLLQVSQQVAVDLVPVTWLDAVEVYRGPATRPMEYRSTRSSCTIALWTR